MSINRSEKLEGNHHKKIKSFTFRGLDENDYPWGVRLGTGDGGEGQGVLEKSVPLRFSKF